MLTTDCYFLVRSIRSIASQHAAQVRNGAYVLAAQRSVVASFGKRSVRRNWCGIPWCSALTWSSLSIAQAMNLINAGLLCGNKQHRAVLLHRLCDCLSRSLVVLCFRTMQCARRSCTFACISGSSSQCCKKNKQKQIQAWGAMRAMPRDGLGVS